MNLKTVVQIMLFVVILGIFYLFYFIYFKKDVSELKKEKRNKENEIKLTQKDEPKDLANKEKLVDENSSNIIKNIEYKSSDKKGNKYMLKADIGEISIDNKNIIKLSKVYGKIMLINKEPINIYSDFAIYNTENHDTEFFDNVIIKFKDNNINSNNFDLFIKDDIAKIYNNVILDNSLSKINADIVNIDLLSGNINVDMFNKSNKVKFLKK